MIDFQKILLSARVGHWTKILRWLGRDIIVVGLPLLVEVLRIVMNSIMLCFIRWFDLKTFVYHISIFGSSFISHIVNVLFIILEPS